MNGLPEEPKPGDTCVLSSIKIMVKIMNRGWGWKLYHESNLGDNLLSPPILPDMLNSDSPCLRNKKDDYDDNCDLGHDDYRYDDGGDNDYD